MTIATIKNMRMLPNVRGSLFSPLYTKPITTGTTIFLPQRTKGTKCCLNLMIVLYIITCAIKLINAILSKSLPNSGWSQTFQKNIFNSLTSKTCKKANTVVNLFRYVISWIAEGLYYDLSDAWLSATIP